MTRAVDAIHIINFFLPYWTFRGASTNSCELKAELFSITYMRNRSVQISLRFVYRRAVPYEVHFLRLNVYIDDVIDFTESRFAAKIRFRKIHKHYDPSPW